MLALRASGPEDEEPVLRALTARDLNDYGVGGVTREVVLDGWRVREFDPALDAVVAEDGRNVLGYAAVFSPGSLAFVDPAHEGRGIGAALLAWAENRARELGQECYRQRVAESNASAHGLLAAAGYRRVRGIRQMVCEIRNTQTRETPTFDGITWASLDVDEDAAALHGADALAFAGNADNGPMSLAGFYDEHLASPDLDPTLSWVLRRGEAVVGFVLCRRWRGGVGFVDILAVDEAERGRGIGRALLLSAFDSFARCGLSEARLDVATDNPRAIRLYERAGMTPSHEAAVFEKEAQPQRAAPSVYPIDIRS